MYLEYIAPIYVLYDMADRIGEALCGLKPAAWHSASEKVYNRYIGPTGKSSWDFSKPRYNLDRICVTCKENLGDRRVY